MTIQHRQNPQSHFVNVNVCVISFWNWMLLLRLWRWMKNRFSNIFEWAIHSYSVFRLLCLLSFLKVGRNLLLDSDSVDGTTFVKSWYDLYAELGLNLQICESKNTETEGPRQFASVNINRRRQLQISVPFHFPLFRNGKICSAMITFRRRFFHLLLIEMKWN